MKDHLAGISGNVSACLEVPSDVKREIIQHLRTKKEKNKLPK
jgi:hypothetical protein